MIRDLDEKDLGEKDAILESSREQQDRSSTKYKSWGYVMAAASMFGASTSTAVSQLLGDAVPLFQLISWRFFAQLVMVTVFLGIKGDKSKFLVPRKHIWPLAAAILCQVVTNLGNYGAATRIPVGTATALVFSFPIVINAVLAHIRQQHTNYLTMVAIYFCSVLSILGVLFLSQPPFIFGALHGESHRMSCNETHPATWVAPCGGKSHFFTMGGNNTTEALPRQKFETELMRSFLDSTSDFTPSLNGTMYSTDFPYLNTTAVTPLNTSLGPLLQVCDPDIEDDEVDVQTYLSITYAVGIALALMAGIANGLRYEIYYHLRDLNSATVNFWVTVGGFLITLIGVPFETLSLPTHAQCVVYFLIIMFMAYNFLAPASLQYILPFEYSLIKSQQLVVLFVLQIMFGGVFRPGFHNWVEYLGAAFCIFGVMGVPWLQYMNASKDVQEMN